MSNFTQKGVINLSIIIVAVVGLLAFLLISNTADFKNKLFGTLFPKPPSKATQLGFEPGKVLVKFKDGVSDEDSGKIIKENGTSFEKKIDKIKVHVLNVPPGKELEIVDKFKKHPKVEFAEVDGKVSAAEIPNDPDFSSQWGYYKINLKDAWNVTHGSSTIKVAVLDTGVDSLHPDLAGKVVLKQQFTGEATAEDNNGHGTHVAGTVAALTNNSIGVAGSGYDTSIISAKVLKADGSGSWSQVANATVWATDNGSKVINMSIVGGYSATMESAVNYAWSNGAVIMASAGNNGTSNPVYPAYFANSIAVANTDQNDNKSATSSFGTWVDIAAPGEGILSTCRGGTYCIYSGTSMASPHVAGIAALIAAANPTWTNTQIRSKLEASADPISGTGTYWLNGRLNACKALDCTTSLSSPTPTPSLPPVETTPPSVAITSPANGAIIVRNSNFTIFATATDNVGVAKVEFLIDGGLKCTDATSLYSCLTKIGGKPGASHTILAKAYDSSGNISSSSITVTVK